mgnify:CR=1 FL=1
MKQKKETKIYTEEELQSIRENLKKAFDIDYIPLSNKVEDLFRNKAIKLQENDILHVHLPYGKEEWDMKPGWYRIKVTYIRSGVVFFKYIDTKHTRKEDHADILSGFIENAYMGTIRMKDVAIKECNIPLVKIERYKNDPYPVELINEDGITVAIL